MDDARPTKRTVLFGKPYWWMSNPDGTLSLRPDPPLRKQPQPPRIEAMLQATRRLLG